MSSQELRSGLPSEIASIAFHPESRCLTVQLADQPLGTDVARRRVIEVLRELLQTHEPRSVVFDVSSRDSVDSGWLSIFVTVQKHGIEVHVLNASAQLRHRLRTTNLDRVLVVDPRRNSE